MGYPLKRYPLREVWLYWIKLFTDVCIFMCMCELRRSHHQCEQLAWVTVCWQAAVTRTSTGWLSRVWTQLIMYRLHPLTPVSQVCYSLSAVVVHRLVRGVANSRRSDLTLASTGSATALLAQINLMVLVCWPSSLWRDWVLAVVFPCLGDSKNVYDDDDDDLCLFLILSK